MTRPPFEVADIVRQHGDRFLETHRAWVTGPHRRVFRAIAQCRTAALGGHRDRCEQCAHPALWYNSCRDRHCPKCLTAARNAWVAAREQELLPVGYVHIVFTMPEPLARLALANKRVVYDLLFQAAAETLLQVAANPKRLGAADWWADGAAHVGPAPAAPSPRPLRRADGRACRRTAPGGSTRGRASSCRFPSSGRSFAASSSPASETRFATGRLDFPGTLAPLKTEEAFRAFLRSLYRQTWVVYAKPPFGSPAHVLHYLARYTHRVAISNHRLVDVTDDTVSFRWKDYRHGSQMRTLTLDADEFLRRFLLHVLPKRFVRIRYFGFLAPRCRTHGLAQCRTRLAVAPPPPVTAPLVGSSPCARGRALAAARPCASSNG